MENILMVLIILMAGTLFGFVLMAMLSASKREETFNEGYIIGYTDGKDNKPPKVRMR